MNTKITTLFDENGRVCSKCNEYKIWDCYYKHSGNRTGHISCCKKCQSLTIEISMRRKEYKYVDKDLLDIEKDYKSKENKILGQMKRVKQPEKEIEKETRSWSEVYPEKKQKKWEGEIIEFGMRPVGFFKNYIK